MPAGKRLYADFARVQAFSSARLDTAQRRMRAFAAGECDTIPELAEPALPYTLLPDGTVDGSYRVGEILSACNIDG